MDLDSIPLTAKIDLWRQKAIAGTLSIDECREAIMTLRNGRITASATSKAGKPRATKATVNSDDLLKDLEGL